MRGWMATDVTHTRSPSRRTHVDTGSVSHPHPPTGIHPFPTEQACATGPNTGAYVVGGITNPNSDSSSKRPSKENKKRIGCSPSNRTSRSMFGTKADRAYVPLYAALAHARTVVFDGDHDVFGDGTVILKFTPGHTPGHQALYVK